MFYSHALTLPYPMFGWVPPPPPWLGAVETYGLTVLPLFIGKTLQVAPMKPVLKVPGAKRLKLECYRVLSSFAFNYNLRCYTLASGSAPGWLVRCCSCASLTSSSCASPTTTTIVGE